MTTSLHEGGLEDASRQTENKQTNKKQQLKLVIYSWIYQVVQGLSKDVALHRCIALKEMCFM